MLLDHCFQANLILAEMAANSGSADDDTDELLHSLHGCGADLRMQRLKNTVMDVNAQRDREYLRFCGGDEPLRHLSRLVGAVTEITLWLFCYRLLLAKAEQVSQETKINDQKGYIHPPPFCAHHKPQDIGYK